MLKPNRIFVSIVLTLLVVFLLPSCGSNSSDQLSDNNDTIQNKDLIEKLSSSKAEASVQDFLTGNQTISVEPLLVGNELDETDKSPSVKVNFNKTSNNYPISSSEVAFRDLEDSALYYQQNIEKLKEIDLRKDEKIITLKKENSELAKLLQSLEKEVEHLKLKSEIRGFSEESELISNEIVDLREKFEDNADIAKDVGQQSKSIDEVLVSDSFEKASPLTKDIMSQVQPKTVITGNIIRPSLQFDAVVTSLNGKSKEAFYTEFFVVETDLEEMLRDVNDLKPFMMPDGPITSYSELWARSRKTPFTYPNVLKTIRTALLDKVSAGKGARIRTDINGSAKIENLDQGDYYIIGTASLGKIGVTWNVPVKLKGGPNKISLTLSNSSWSE